MTLPETLADASRIVYQLVYGLADILAQALGSGFDTEAAFGLLLLSLFVWLILS